MEYDSGGFDQGMGGGRQGITSGVNQIDTESGADSGSIDSFNITAYTSTIADPVYIMGALGYGPNEFDSTRSISALNPNGVANGSTSGNQLMGLLKYGLFANTDRRESQVFVSGQYAGLRQDGFVETGAGAVNLNVGDSSTKFIPQDYRDVNGRQTVTQGRTGVPCRIYSRVPGCRQHDCLVIQRDKRFVPAVWCGFA